MYYIAYIYGMYILCHIHARGARFIRTISQYKYRDKTYILYVSFNRIHLMGMHLYIGQTVFTARRASMKIHKKKKEILYSIYTPQNFEISSI